jgi:hypothetical protein
MGWDTGRDIMRISNIEQGMVKAEAMCQRREHHHLKFLVRYSFSHKESGITYTGRPCECLINVEVKCYITSNETILGKRIGAKLNFLIGSRRI